MLKLYTYSACSTCRTAVKWLRSAGIDFTEVPIRDTPPTVPELRAALAANDGQARGLLNTSGQDYRALGLKDKLPGMAPEALLKLLASNGNLVKRPFAVDADRGVYLNGFNEAVWAKKLPG